MGGERPSVERWMCHFGTAAVRKMRSSCILTHMRFGNVLIFNELQMVFGGTLIAKFKVMMRTTKCGYRID